MQTGKAGAGLPANACDLTWTGDRPSLSSPICPNRSHMVYWKPSFREERTCYLSYSLGFILAFCHANISQARKSHDDATLPSPTQRSRYCFLRRTCRRWFAHCGLPLRTCIGRLCRPLHRYRSSYCASEEPKFGFIAGATTGIADASAGWWVSWLIGPGRPPSGSINLTQWLVTAAMVTTVGCVVAGVSGVIATWGRRSIWV
jgi:hypothetical protein